MTSTSDYPSGPLAAIDAGGAFEIGGGDFNWGQNYTESTIRAMFQPPIPTPLNALEQLRKQLMKLPHEVLKAFKDLIPDVLEDAWETVEGAANAIIGALTDGPRSLLRGEWLEWLGDTFYTISTELKQIMEVLAGLVVTPINNAVQQVKDWWTEVNSGIQNGIDYVDDLMGDLWGGFTGLFGGGKKSSADVANAAQQTAGTATVGLQLAEWTDAVLGIRNTNGFDSGMDPTAVANFELPGPTSAGGDPPYITVTQSVVPITFWLSPNDANRGVVNWYGRGKDNISSFNIDVYVVDRDTKQLTFHHSSPDLTANLSAGWKSLRYEFLVPDRIKVAHGDVLAFAFRLGGAGQHQIVAKWAGWMPGDTSQTPQRPSAQRAGGTVGTAALNDLTWAGDIPWVAVGIVEGDVAPPTITPRRYEVPDTGQYAYNVPDWADEVDCIKLGAAGGGHGGSGAVGAAGDAGEAGEYHVETLKRGIHFPDIPNAVITGYVGVGGGRGGKELSGSSGEATYRDAIPGYAPAAVAPGGRGGQGYGDSGGKSPGNVELNGQVYVGGKGGKGGSGGNGGDGGDPGGSGGGGGGFVYGVGWAGGRGGRGATWFYARQAS